MRATGALLLLPLRSVRFGFFFVAGVCLLGGACVSPGLAHGATPAAVFLPLFAIALYFLCTAYGTALASVLVNESRLLPDFTRHMVRAICIVWLIIVGAPGVYLGLVSQLSNTDIGVSLGTLIMACALAAPIQKIYTLVVIILVVAAPNLPEAELANILDGLRSPIILPAIFVAALFVLWHSIGRRLRATDPTASASPMAMITSRWVTQPTDTRFTGRGLSGLLRGVFEGGSDYTLQRAIAAQRRRDSRWHRAMLFRAVLLPYDNVIGATLNSLVAMVPIGMFLLIAIFQKGSGDAHSTAFMALVLGRLRCTSIGASFAKMRPHLADLYLALAPQTRADFQKRVFDTLATVIPVVVVHTLLGGVLLYVFVGDARPGAMLGSLAVAGAAMALVDLSIQLVGSRNRAAQFVIIAFTMAIYAVAYLLLYYACLWIGTPLGLLAAGLPIMAAAAAVFWLARDVFAGQPPAFDRPISG